MCLNKQDSEYASGPKCTRILNKAKITCPKCSLALRALFFS